MDDRQVYPEHRAARRTWPFDAAALIFLALLPPVVLKELPGGLPPYGGDVFVHVYPLLSLLAHGIQAGRPTLWNFYAAGGYPLAPYSALVVYPPIALALALWPVTGAIAVLYALSLAALGIGMYLLSGDLGQSRPARLLSAITLSYGGFVAAHVYGGHLFELCALCPFPLAFFALRRAILRHSLPAALWCGALLGLMLMAAGLQFLPFVLPLLPLLALWHTMLRLGRGGDSTQRQMAPILWPCLALGIAVVVAVALSAVLLVPFGEILPYTLRSGPVPYATAAVQSLPWGGLVMLVAPDALGNAAADTYWPASRFGPYFHEIYAYAGLLPLLLAPVALIRTRAARPYGLLAILALLVMLGRNTPVYWLLYHLPGAGLFRAPARAGITLDVALAVLAGFGLDALISVGCVSGMGAAAPRSSLARGAVTRRRAGPAIGPLAAIAALGVLLVIAFLSGSHGIPVAARPLALAAAGRLALLLAAGIACCLAARRLEPRVALLLPALALLDLASANGVLFHPVNPAAYYSNTVAVEALGSEAGRYRFLALDNAITGGTSMVTRRFYDVQDSAPLPLADYWTLSHPFLVRQTGGVVVTGHDTIGVRDVDPFFLRLFGVRTIFSAPSVPLRLPYVRPVGRIATIRWTVPGGAHWNARPYGAASLVYRDDSALPRLFTVSRAITASPETALRLLRSGQIDPARAVVLSASEQPLGDLLGAVQRRWTSWLGDDPDNGLSVRVDAGTRGGYLVVDDGWFPGWTATVDGRPVAVWRADYLLRAVRLPSGPHQVRLVYAPLSYLLGLSVTVLAVVVLLLAAVWRIGRSLLVR